MEIQVRIVGTKPLITFKHDNDSLVVDERPICKDGVFHIQLSTYAVVKIVKFLVRNIHIKGGE
jgi:hypothetical protein